MKFYKFIFSIMLLLSPLVAQAQLLDSVDVQDYDVSLDLTQGKPFPGDATLTLKLTRPCNTISLSLRGTLDSLWVNGVAVENPMLAAIPTAGIAVGQDFTIRACYRGSGYVEPMPYSFGGFHFENNLSYNLGVGFATDPHVVGNVMMPCCDNYYDKATYTLRIHAKSGWTAECSGLLQGRTVADDGTEYSVWRINHPVPTYLVGVSQAAWNRYYHTISSLYGDYPLTVGYLAQDSNRVVRSFEELDSVVPMFERCFGPYRWDRIGYIATSKGSMEHVHNIALAYQAMASVTEEGQNTIAHELGHAWFGNLVTCNREEDMWFNEGGASFCSEVAMQSVSGKEASDKYYQKNLEAVIRATHFTDDGYRALSPMPHSYTYGSTSYNKGWMMWHSLRGYMGDSLFYASIQRLMESKAYGGVDVYEVLDSLNLYSGMDLTDFFNFHIFTPGFVDYHVDVDYVGGGSHRAVVTVRQQGVGTDVPVRSNRVPVTFFSRGGEQYKYWVAFAGNDTTLTVNLPFDDPAYHVLDYDLEISDAATNAYLTVLSSGTQTVKWAHTRLSSEGECPVGTPVVIEHHWGHPWDIDTTTGVLRTANRYWIVRSPESYLASVTGLFRFVRDGYTGGDYPYLDNGFYSRTTSLDSIRLLYREDASHPWVSVSNARTGNENEGYYYARNLRTGEYTLAVVDTHLVGIHSPVFSLQSPLLTLFPNPVKQGEMLAVEVDIDAPFTLTIYDAEGRKIWRRRGLRNGDAIKPQLALGTYLVQIENKFVSLQSKLIVL